jgi:hypothetical protein
MKRIKITESQYKRLVLSKKLNENIVLDVAGDLTGDALRDLLSAIPLVGDLGVAVPSIIKNLKEIKTGTKDLINTIENQKPTEEEVREMQSDIIGDLLDLFQAILGVSPDPGATEIVSFMSSISFNVARVLGGDEIITFLSKRSKFIDFMKKHEDSPLIKGLIPKDINPTNIVIDAFDALDKSSVYLETATDKMSLDQKVSKKAKDLGKYLS